MKKARNRITLLLCFALLLTAWPAAAKGDSEVTSEVPYQTYAYDKWDNAVPVPNGYLPVRSVGGAQLGCGDFNAAQYFYYNESLGLIFIADTGNSRIVILDKDLAYVSELTTLTREGESYALNTPQGLCALDDGTLYICDTGNQKVVRCTCDGELLSILPTPESTLLPDDFRYMPTRITIDDSGRIYIISKGTYQGLIYLEADGSFIKFFGANNVEMTLRRRILKIWKTILPDEAAAGMQSFNPIEYGNLFYTKDGYIYATAAGSENGSSVLTKLNPVGIDTLPYTFKGSVVFADVSVDENGITTLMNSTSGSIMQVDETGRLMFSFGGIGNQTGLFQKPVSIIEVDGQLYVLDAEKNSITAFALTPFGAMVREAVALYDEGEYEQSIEPWQKVAAHSANYLLAYIGLGKAYYQLGDYDTAMYYFRLANDRADYSLAFKEANLIRVRGAFAYIVLGIVILIAAVVAGKLLRKRRKAALEKAGASAQRGRRKGGAA